MYGREKLETFTSCELYNPNTDTFKVGEVLLKDEADKVMDSIERRIARLFNLVAGYQRNSLGLSAMYKRRLDSELERIQELEAKLYGSKGETNSLLNRINNFRSTDPKATDLIEDCYKCIHQQMATISKMEMSLPTPPTTEDK